MTLQNDHSMPNSSAYPQNFSVDVPNIQCEEDIPFDVSSGLFNSSQDELSKTDSLEDQITKFKYLTGREVLYISMAAMGISVAISILLSFYGVENSLVENAFEVFKLIAMTVLGYLFGSKAK